MSNNESLDEETKRILAEVQPDSQRGSDESTDSKSKKVKKEYKNDDFNDYDVSDKDPLKDDEMDDKDW